MDTTLILNLVKIGLELYGELKHFPVTDEDLQKEKQEMLKKLKQAAIEYEKAKNK
jgi:hypothetical protein